jgi:hypothetical protein
MRIGASALLLAIAIAAPRAAAQPGPAVRGLALPERTDIAAGFSTKICPDRAAAERLLADFYAPNRPPINLIDIPLFMRGLGETGCEQRSGPVVILEVLARRTLDLGSSSETHIAYRGRRPDGSEVWGVVDESWNNRIPRSPLEAFVQSYTNEGWLPVRGDSPAGAARLLACPSAAAARAVVAAIPEPRAGSERRSRRAFDRAIRAHRCTPTRPGSSFRVTTVHRSNWIDCGRECTTNWTPLTARTRQGLEVGLLHGTEDF